MNRPITNLKDNTFNTFYTTQLNPYNDHQPFAAYKKLFQANAETLDHLTIEAETLLHKLAQKISLDESKIEKNFIELSQIGEEIEQTGAQMLKQREIDNIIKNKKEAVRQLCGEKKHMIQHWHQKGERELKNCTDIVQEKERQLQAEREAREEGWSLLIDEFQKEITRIQKQFKDLRTKDDQVFEQNSVDLYNFESKIKQKLQEQQQTRKKQHEMVVRLVSQCIENIRYAY